MSVLTPVDVFNSLSAEEKQKVLSTLQNSQQTPCQKQGHRYKSVGVKQYWLWKPKIVMVCERCGVVKYI